MHRPVLPVRPVQLAGRVAASAGTLLAVSWLAGCGGGGADEAGPQRLADSGREMVRHGDLAGYGRPILAAEHFLAIGEEGGAPEYSFGEVAGLELMPNRTIAVLDGQAAEVRTFAPDGSFIRKIGRRGEGPGELSGEGSLAVVAVGPSEFAVPDIITQTLNVYSLEGDLVRSSRFDIQRAYIPEWRTTDDPQPVVRVSTPGVEVVAHYSADDMEGAPGDTLAVVERPPTPEATDGQQPLWLDHLVWSFGKPGVVVAGWMSTPEFTIYSGGEAVRTVSWDFEPARLTQDDQDAVLGIVASGMGTDAASLPAEFRAQLRLPERLPAMADIEVAGDLVLVQRVRPVAAMDRRVIYTFKAAGFGARIWDVFSIEGDYLGELDLGARADVYSVRGDIIPGRDIIVGVRENDAGLQQVFLAQLPKGLP